MNEGRSFAVLIGPLLLLAVGCASVNPGPLAEVPVYPKPVVEEISISGLTFRDERLAGRSVSSGVVTGSTIDTATIEGPSGTATRSTVGTLGSHTETFETFENSELEGLLRTLIEDSKIARRVVPETALTVRGVILETNASTGPGKILWNILNTVSLLFFFGSPYLGTADATVQLRVYDAGEVVQRIEGHGTASWRLPGFGLMYTIGPTKRQAQIMAAGVATRDAVARLGPYLARRRSE